MKTAANILIVAILAMMLSACGNPAKQVAVGLQAYNATLTTAIDLRQQGKITDAQYRNIEVARATAWAALSAAADDVAAGGTLNTQAKVDTLLKALTAFSNAMKAVQ